jgi:hypothetical protein
MEHTVQISATFQSVTFKCHASKHRSVGKREVLTKYEGEWDEKKATFRAWNRGDKNSKHSGHQTCLHEIWNFLYLRTLLVAVRKCFVKSLEINCDRHSWHRDKLDTVIKTTSVFKNFRYIKHIYTFTKVATCFDRGPGELSQYSDSLRPGRSKDRIPVRARFSAPVQTGPGAHQASYTMGTWSLSRG